MPVFSDILMTQAGLPLINVGIIGDQIIAVVVHTERSDTIRIISARKANRIERVLFHEYLKNKM